MLLQRSPSLQNLLLENQNYVPYVPTCSSSSSDTDTGEELRRARKLQHRRFRCPNNYFTLGWGEAMVLAGLLAARRRIQSL